MAMGGFRLFENGQEKSIAHKETVSERGIRQFLLFLRIN